jgi:replicative DNA helicase
MAVRERSLPQHLEAEQAVLGAMLIDRDAVPRAVDLLEPEDFYRPAHRLIYECMLELFDKSEPVDVVTVAAALKAQGKLEAAGGAAYLAELQDAVPTSANVSYHAQIVADRALLRALIAAGTEIVRRGYEAEEEATTLLDEAEERIFRLSQRRGRHAYAPLRKVLIETFQHIEERYKNPGVTGVPSGFPDLDHLTSGFQPSELTVIAARPSMGKTMFCLNVARQAAVQAKVPVAIFSLEMSREQLALRLLCAEAGIDSQKIRRGEVNPEEWQVLSLALGQLGDAPIFIDDSPALSALDIRARARRLRAEHGVGLVIIDYLQLMQAGARAENRQQEISQISRSLKALARELEVPVIALSQLSRAVEARQDRRPMLSDLRESGAIEQDADVVAFIYRDDYYHPDTDQPGIVEVIVAKQRNGPTGVVRLHFRKETGRFYSLDRAHVDEEPEG